MRGLEAKADTIASGATDFVRANASLDGGITGVMKIAALAEAHGLDVELHGGGMAHRTGVRIACSRERAFESMQNGRKVFGESFGIFHLFWLFYRLPTVYLYPVGLRG